jgi:hypothetical protein
VGDNSAGRMRQPPPPTRVPAHFLPAHIASASQVGNGKKGGQGEEREVSKLFYQEKVKNIQELFRSCLKPSSCFCFFWVFLGGGVGCGSLEKS